MQILRVIALLSFCTCSAGAQESNTDILRNSEVIGEIGVKGVHRCGSWPIQHQGLRGCEYAVLKREDLQTVLNLRQEFFQICLNCQGNRCIEKVWREDRMMEKLLCKRLFLTPTRISRPDFFGHRISPMRVWFTFKISSKGKVEDIEVVSFEGDIAEAELLQLIRDGAMQTRFEPLVIADMAYEIVDLHDAFVLDDF